MNIRRITEEAKSLIILREFPRIRTVEQKHCLIWRSIGQALYDAMGSYEQEQKEKKRNT